MSDVPKPMFGDPIGPWRTVFAWLPKQLYDGTWIWLHKLSRRRIQQHSYLDGGALHWWQYADLRGEQE